MKPTHPAPERCITALKPGSSTVYCSAVEANSRPATYKIASVWNRGGFQELQTFGYADDACLVEVYAAAVARRERTPVQEGETQGALRVYWLEPDCPDRLLRLAWEAEQRLGFVYDDEARDKEPNPTPPGRQVGLVDNDTPT